MSDFTLPTNAVPDVTPDKPLLDVEVTEESEEKEEKIYSEKELENFWISLMNKEPYVEEFEVRGMPVILKAPIDKVKSEMEILQDSSGVRTREAYEQYSTRLLIAATVVKCGKYKVQEDDTLVKKLEALKDVPLPLYDFMIRLVGRFNEKILRMLDEVTQADFFGVDSQ